MTTTTTTTTTADGGPLHDEWGVSAGWRGRGSLRDLVTELDRQKASMHDFVVDTRNLGVVVEDGRPRLVPDGPGRQEIIDAGFLPSGGAALNASAVAQLGERMAPKVPVRFLRELVGERPAIAERLLTDLLHATGTHNLVRCLDGGVRAFLSDRYAPMDHYTLAFAALDVAREHGGEVVEASLTDRHMRLKMTSRTVFDALDEARQSGDKRSWYAGGLGNQTFLNRVSARSRGDLPGGPGTVHPLVSIGNSETGHGSQFVRSGILRAICYNLATVETVVSNVHLGSRLDPGMFSIETMRLDAQAVMAKASDAIRASFDEARFERLVARCKAAQMVPVSPTQAVDFAAAQNIVSEEQRDALLGYFLGGEVEGRTAYGFAQAVARLAQDLDDPDRADELETFAGAILSRPEQVRERVLTAAV